MTLGKLLSNQQYNLLTAKGIGVAWNLSWWDLEGGVPLHTEGGSAPSPENFLVFDLKIVNLGVF